MTAEFLTDNQIDDITMNALSEQIDTPIAELTKDMKLNKDVDSLDAVEIGINIEEQLGKKDILLTLSIESLNLNHLTVGILCEEVRKQVRACTEKVED